MKKFKSYLTTWTKTEVILAIIGLLMTWYLSRQQQNINGFDTLLRTSKMQVDTLTELNKILSKQLVILDSQLIINQSGQKEANINSANLRKADKLKFQIAVGSLASTITNCYTDSNYFFSLINNVSLRQTKNDVKPNWAQKTKNEFVEEAKTILKNEFNNSFLLSNGSLAREWKAAYDTLSHYAFLSKYLPIQKYTLPDTINPSEPAIRKYNEKFDREWWVCFTGVIELIQHCVKRM